MKYYTEFLFHILLMKTFCVLFGLILYIVGAEQIRKCFCLLSKKAPN